MSKIVKNTTGSDFTVSGTGQTIAASGQYTIQEGEGERWANSSDLMTKIGSGDAVINDGTKDLSVSDGIDHIKGYFQKTPITAIQKIPKVAIYSPEGSSTTKVTHNFCDKTTWFSKSVPVTAETLSLDTGKIYDFANNNIIDLTHGRHYSEDDFSPSYPFKVYDNAVLKVEGTDYEMDYDLGKVTFDAGYTVIGPVTADYSYANGSEWVLKPSAGKVLHLQHAELQFSENIGMSPVMFQIWVYNPADLPNKIMVQQTKYKNIRDIIGAANLGQGFIPAIDILTQNTLVFPFNYATVKSLKYTDGAELRIVIEDDNKFTGEFGTATFYVLSEDL